jgi:hypothetical protein
MKTTRQAILDQQALNRKIYAGDTRYEKVYEQMQLLGIQDVTTHKQSRNGTVVWRLPILSDRPGKYIEYASFKSGYIRNQGIDCHSNWQINKRKMSEPFYYPEYEWKSGYQVKTGKYLKFTSRGCELIPIEIDRLEYMLKYIVKNEYIKKANRVQEGKFVPKWKHEDEIKRTKELHVWQEEPEVKVIVNGHRYNITP